MGIFGRFRFYNTLSTGFAAETFRIPSDQRVGAASSVEVGSLQTLNVNQSQIGIAKGATSTTAPGASGLKLGVICGTNPGTLMIVAYAGSSTTPSTVVDNVGAGVTGC